MLLEEKLVLDLKHKEIVADLHVHTLLKNVRTSLLQGQKSLCRSLLSRLLCLLSLEGFVTPQDRVITRSVSRAPSALQWADGNILNGAKFCECARLLTSFAMNVNPYIWSCRPSACHPNDWLSIQVFSSLQQGSVFINSSLLVLTKGVTVLMAKDFGCLLPYDWFLW